MEGIRILFPLQGSTVRHKAIVAIQADHGDKFPQVFVLAHDELWYKQAPAHKTISGFYIANAILGFEENRSGWEYIIVAVRSDVPLDDIIQKFPDGAEASNTVKVIRK